MGLAKWQQGNLVEVEEGQGVRILSGKLADYNKVWTVSRISQVPDGERHFVLKAGPERKVFWEMEAEAIEVEIA